jgi:hypothetical protein
MERDGGVSYLMQEKKVTVSYTSGMIGTSRSYSKAAYIGSGWTSQLCDVPRSPMTVELRLLGNGNRFREDTRELGSSPLEFIPHETHNYLYVDLFHY